MRMLESYFLTWLLFMTCCGLMEVFPQQTTQCGIRRNATPRRRIKRVIGGTIARSNAWPWLVNMLDKNDSLQYCSGVIIGPQWILTVAHCFIYYGSNQSITTLPVTKYKYIVADHRYNTTDPYEYTVEPSQLFIHPNHKLGDDVQPGDYDVALIKLKKPLQFTNHVKQACLPSNNTTFSSTTLCYLAGWGNTVNTSNYHRSKILREVQLNLVSNKACNDISCYNGSIPARFRCAGFPSGGKDGCYGDSGAPLQCNIQGRWTVAGLMSWGSGCGQANRYGVYTDVQVLWNSFIKPVLDGPVDRLTTYHKRPLNRFRKNWKVDEKSLYFLFTKNETFIDLDLVRNLQLIPLQITLLKYITLVEYAFIMDTSVPSLKSRSTPLNQIVAEFQQHSKKFENYVKIKTFGKVNNKSVTDVIKMARVSKADILNARNPLKLLKKISRPTKLSVNSMSG